MNLTVIDNPNQQRFEARTDQDNLAAYIKYERSTDWILLVETEVDERYQDEGVGSWITRATLEELGAQGITVINHCPFIRRFIQRHADEYSWVQ